MPAYHDPTCPNLHPSHTCRRRDGVELNGTNGDCFVNAHSEARTLGLRERPCGVCQRSTWEPSAYCYRHQLVSALSHPVAA